MNPWPWIEALASIAEQIGAQGGDDSVGAAIRQMRERQLASAEQAGPRRSVASGLGGGVPPKTTKPAKDPSKGDQESNEGSKDPDINVSETDTTKDTDDLKKSSGGGGGGLPIGQILQYLNMGQSIAGALGVGQQGPVASTLGGRAMTPVQEATALQIARLGEDSRAGDEYKRAYLRRIYGGVYG